MKELFIHANPSFVNKIDEEFVVGIKGKTKSSLLHSPQSIGGKFRKLPSHQYNYSHQCTHITLASIYNANTSNDIYATRFHLRL